MTKNTKIFPKSNQEMRRLKIATHHKSKVDRGMILRQVKIHKATYLSSTINKMKIQRTWIRKGVHEAIVHPRKRINYHFSIKSFLITLLHY